jgi:hypothetical protein
MDRDEVEIRPDEPITTMGGHTVDPDDAFNLHDWPGNVEGADEPVTVAVMDSGIHEDAVSDHPWFDEAAVVERYDATGTGTGGDAVGHGTGCASIIAKAATNASETLVTEVPPVEFYDVRIFGDSGRTGMSTILDAYRYLLDTAADIDIVNMSWGARRDVSAINQPHEELIAAGVHDCVAAGNTGEDGGSPATADGAFSVGALTEDGEPTRFSSFNPDKGNPDVAAVGKDTKMARAPGTSMGSPLGDDFTKASGTSFAAPYTASGYVLAHHQKPASWDKRLMGSATDIPGTPKDGGGVLKLSPALDGRTPDSPDPTANAEAWGFSVGEVVYLDADWIPDDASEAVLRDESKRGATIEFRE